ncbi:MULTISPECIES: DUF2777 family protein [Bacillaceae]|uniref:DUF2777 domain-containing protein n=1 Tax=Evansella alkalicola TaxID=745819 RepID=A0ABS6JZ67_9BACI|nr:MULTISPECIES: DUF2777 family protein [Bacillaceae]MBU9723887.1 DUF2777 domain-containing protein [Bacillus alkalicola]
MDRNTAKNHIGKWVIINEGNQGQYIGILEEMKTEPNKPWRAIVRIKGVYVYPDFSLEKLDLVKPVFKENERYECSGQKIDPFNESFSDGYNESLAYSLKDKWDEVHQINQDTEAILSLIQQELRRLNSEHLIFEASYVYYQLVKKGRSVHIYDELKRESLALDGCPFEFEIHDNGLWIPALHVKGLVFETEDGKQVELNHGSTVRLNKSQFDPYQMLLNELEEPSLHALEKGLKQLQIGHEHSVYCHNSLLIKLLSSFDEEELNGVNFISYSNDKNQFVVQHHYERGINDLGENTTYDRFEFTSDSGERILTTYTTQFSND